MPTGSVTPGAVTPPFNGGTITNALDIIPTDNATCLVVEPTATSGSNGVVFIGQNQDLDDGDPLAVRIKPSGGSFGDVLRVDNNGSTRITPAFTGIVPLRVNLFGGGSVLRVNASGALGIQLNSAPASGDLEAGECSLWFDQTNGASALNIKAKQADGTVKTATIPVIT